LKSNKSKIKEDVDEIIARMKSGKYDEVIYPEAGVGTGVAGLPGKAPLTYGFVLEEIERLKKWFRTRSRSRSRSTKK
jgi:hypothetical protein